MSAAERLAVRILDLAYKVELAVKTRGRPVMVDGKSYTEIVGHVVDFTVPPSLVPRDWSADSPDVPMAPVAVSDVLDALAPAYAALPSANIGHLSVDQRDVGALWLCEMSEYGALRADLDTAAAVEGADRHTRRVVAVRPRACRSFTQVLVRSRVHVVATWRSQLVVPLLPLDILGLLADGVHAASAIYRRSGERDFTPVSIPPLEVTMMFGSLHLAQRGSWRAASDIVRGGQ